MPGISRNSARARTVRSSGVEVGVGVRFIIGDFSVETIAWRTLPGQAIQTAGSVTFKSVAGGTDVRVHLQYTAPGGKAASWLASLAGQDPAKYTREALRALKRRLEVPPPAAPTELSASPTH